MRRGRTTTGNVSFAAFDSQGSKGEKDIGGYQKTAAAAIQKKKKKKRERNKEPKKFFGKALAALSEF